MMRRELEIGNFLPQAYFEVVFTAIASGGQFQMRHAPQERIVRREVAQAVVEAAQDFEGALGVRVEDNAKAPRSAFAAEIVQLALRLAGQQDAGSRSGTL